MPLLELRNGYGQVCRLACGTDVEIWLCGSYLSGWGLDSDGDRGSSSGNMSASR